MPIPIPLSVDKLEQLASKFGTPFYIYDESAIRTNCRHLQDTFAPYFPNFKEFFAVKALPNPAILKIMKSENFGLDCSSRSELFIADKLGFKGSNVLYSSNYTSKEDLEYALDKKVIINLDDISLLQYLRETRRIPKILSFRLNPGMGATNSETRSNVLGGRDSKFGIPLKYIVEAYQKAKNYGVQKFGIHTMSGSCVLDYAYFEELISILLETMSQIQRKLNITFEFLNIGGGFGIPYKARVKALDIERIATVFKRIYDFKTIKCNLGNPKLYMEHGRYITGPFGWLVSRCKAIKKRYGTFYGLDACMANLMRPGMYGAYHHITIPRREKEMLHRANVVGTICENNDWFARNRLLPKAKIGDLFVIHDVGAHGHAMGFQYNGKLRCAELLIRTNGNIEFIRKHEVIEDLYRNTVMPPDLGKI